MRSPLAPSQVGPSALWRQGCSGGGGGELVENNGSGELLFFDRLDFFHLCVEGRGMDWRGDSCQPGWGVSKY